MPNAVLRPSTVFPGERGMVLLLYTGNAEISPLGAASGAFYKLVPGREHLIDKRDLPSLNEYRELLLDASVD